MMRQARSAHEHKQQVFSDCIRQTQQVVQEESRLVSEIQERLSIPETCLAILVIDPETFQLFTARN